MSMIGHCKRGDQRALGIGVLAILLLVPTSSATAGHSVVGSLSFSEAAMIGESNVDTQSVAVIHATAGKPKDDLSLEDAALEGVWTLTAARTVTAWSRLTVTGVGSSPGSSNESFATVGSPQASSGEESFADGTFLSEITGSSGNLLLLPREGSALEFHAYNVSRLNAQPSQGEKWSAGRYTNLSQGQTYQTETFETELGEPIFRSTTPVGWTAKGDFTMYIWGANVTANDGTQTTTYRSGSWYENATGSQLGPRGLARTEYWQLLTMTAFDATIRFDMSEGLAQWAALDSTIQTSGQVSFLAASGRFDSPTSIYQADRQPVQIGGMVSQRVQSAAASPANLFSRVDGSDSYINLASAAAKPKVPALDGGAASWMVGGFLLIALLVTATIIARRAWRGGSWDREMVKASEALVNRHNRRARWRARRLLRRDPKDADAWLVYGASLHSDDAHERVIREIGPVAQRLEMNPSLSFLVGVSSVKLSRMKQAAKWLQAAGRDPVFLREIQQSPLFEGLRIHSRRRAWAADGDNAAYG